MVWGWPMGPTALIGDDVAAGRLIAPFPEVSLSARSYFAYLPVGSESGSQTAVFCDWLEGAVCTMCAPGDQRKSSDNQSEQCRTSDLASAVVDIGKPSNECGAHLPDALHSLNK